MARVDYPTLADLALHADGVSRFLEVYARVDRRLVVQRAREQADGGIVGSSTEPGRSGGHSDPTGTRGIDGRRAVSDLKARFDRSLADLAFLANELEVLDRAAHANRSEIVSTHRAEVQSGRGVCSGCGKFCTGEGSKKKGDTNDSLTHRGRYRLCPNDLKWAERHGLQSMRDEEIDDLVVALREKRGYTLEEAS